MTLTMVNELLDTRRIDVRTHQELYGKMLHKQETPIHMPNPLQYKKNGRRAWHEKLGWGTIVGSYLYSEESKYIYSAYHIQFDSGKQRTIFPQYVRTM